MEFVLRHARSAGVFGWLYAVVLFHAFQYFALNYIHSSFLEQYLNKTGTGFLFAIGFSLSALVLFYTATFLGTIGAYRTALTATALNLTALLGLAFASHVGLLFVFFCLHIMAVPVSLFSFDIFIKNYTKETDKTGAIRGLFLTVTTLASLVAPLATGLVVGAQSNYELAYLLGALFLIPVLVFLVVGFRNFIDPAYTQLTPHALFRLFRINVNVSHISYSNFLLYFYFSWMAIYLPIHLHETVGFSWPEIGTILFLMLVPYLLIEYPVGVIADKYLGEKELLYAGYCITSVATVLLYFISTPSILLWSGVLFMTRVGTALIGTMNETYFFKQISNNDAGILGIYRMLRPLASALAPFIAGVLLLFTDIQSMWLILSAVIFTGVVSVYAIVDTR